MHTIEGWECTTETFVTHTTDLGWIDVRISIYRRGDEYQIVGSSRSEWRPTGEDAVVSRRCYRENVCDAVKCVANDLGEADREAETLAAKAARAIITGLDPLGW